MQSGPCAGMIDSGAGQSGLAVRARGAGAGQDQVVDELALSDLIYGRSINQAERFAPRGRHGLFLLRLQFMFDGAGGVGDDGHRDEQTRRGHRNLLFAYDSCTRLRAAAAITIFLARWRAGAAARVARGCEVRAQQAVGAIESTSARWVKKLRQAAGYLRFATRLLPRNH